MAMIKVPYGRGHLEFAVPTENLVGVFESRLSGSCPSAPGLALVEQSLAEPIGSPVASVLASGKRTAVIIASDHTRPVPSQAILPPLLQELRRGNPGLEITILIATGMHRASTNAELLEKFGPEVMANERIVVHDSRDPSQLVNLGVLPSGGQLWINRIAVETDLLLAEGFIEPHFFAGFSGGRKSILPGIAGEATVLANHCAEFIASPQARAGILDGNPMHRDMVWAARQAGLAFIVNVVINGSKQVVQAFSGDPFAAHAAGCEFVRSQCQVKVPPADIIITGNGGYPLDQNVYQAVKGMSAAEAAAAPGAVIIMAAQCADGHGGQAFHDLLASAASPAELSQRLAGVPQDQTVADQWESQVLARILCRHQVILVSQDCDPDMVRRMHLQPASSAEEALGMAFARQGRDARVAVIPDGVAVIAEALPAAP
ncbi:MAG TPA: nickel-dependent lactate racemase [Lentisphaeria bacterium]|nr:nickel-dependent lactate racemase [Lentisphaerota bacterium]OQC12206.1 MAG: hypothetical protein BWX73_03041 [Lentisphaerae bacterium ADurb.Bin082]HPY89653.1 nickel-dependent lactate racemase [Lentisphaeria bacterium]HQC52502.1 nickel-dependent lactate racemase [Lentisphaeria bacterium]HQL88191.1 nickel-dependent lactate racemase [Lentisphaeria bacterium]